VSLAGTEAYLRDGGGNVVTISRQSLGSTEYDEDYVDISGVTIESPNNYAEAGVAFFNSSGRISDSVIGPLKRAANSTELTAKPHGWGVIATNSLAGAGSGAPERQVTIVNSRVFGYQSGGIRFDDARGTDASATAKEPSGMKEVGYVKNTLVEGSGSSTLIPQTGIQYHAGAAGTVTGSKVTGNLFPAEPRKSVGVLLTGAETLNGGFSITGSAITGNGYGLFNADVKNEAVREAAPATATGDFWGTNGTPIVGQTVIGPPDEEGISGLDAQTEPKPSVIYGPVAASTPTVAGPAATLPDAAPSGEIVDPGDGEEVEPGKTIGPVVATEDDYGVKSVSLTVDGTALATLTQSPYVFSWTPSAADAGKTVTLEATVTDSSGQTTTSTITVPVKAAVVPPPVEKPVEKATPPSNAITLGKVKQLAKKGIATLAVEVPGPGELVASGPKVKAVTLDPSAAGEESVTVKPTGKALTALKKRGKATVKVKLVFTPTGGTSSTTMATVVLIKK
jgi:hypothetical protein